MYCNIENDTSKSDKNSKTHKHHSENKLDPLAEVKIAVAYCHGGLKLRTTEAEVIHPSCGAVLRLPTRQRSQISPDSYLKNS